MRFASDRRLPDAGYKSRRESKTATLLAVMVWRAFCRTSVVLSQNKNDQQKQIKPTKLDAMRVFNERSERFKCHFWREHHISNSKKAPHANCVSGLSTGGRRWIRTTEVTDNRFTVCPLWPLGNSPLFNKIAGENGAGGRIRTPDLLITNQLLYQLSYTSEYL